MDDGKKARTMSVYMGRVVLVASGGSSGSVGSAAARARLLCDEGAAHNSCFGAAASLDHSDSRPGVKGSLLEGYGDWLAGLLPAGVRVQEL